MNQVDHKMTEYPLARWLLAAASIAWLASLALTGFVVEPATEPWFGARVLTYGLLFGWLCHGWAVYANLFFLLAAARLFAGRVPVASTVIMLAFVATLPLFKGVPRDEGSGTILPLVSWGLGTFLWLGSFGLLVSALVAQMRFISIRRNAL